MKKRNVVVIILIIALLLMGSAYAAWTDTVAVNVTAESATLNVLFTERTQNATATTSSTGVVHSVVNHDFTVATDTINETITNLVPGETISITYKIENTGTLAVDLDSLVINHTDTEMPIAITWAITEYTNPAVAGDTDNGTASQPSFTGIDIAAADQYCLLTLTVAIDESGGPEGPYTTVQSAAFSVSLNYTQK